MQIVYLPMPVSFEVKREWNKKGYRVVDVQHAPADYVSPDAEQEESSVPKRGRAKK